VSRRHVRFEALLPPGVRSLHGLRPWPGGGRCAGALLGFFPSRACSSTTPGPVSRKGARYRGRAPISHVSGNPAPRYVCETRAPTPGLMSPGSAGVRNRSNPHTTVRQRPSSSQRSRRLPAPAANRATLPSRVRPRRSVLPAPPLGGAPRLPRPWRPIPRRGSGRWTSETLCVESCLVDPPLARWISSRGVSSLVEPPRSSELAPASGLSDLRA